MIEKVLEVIGCKSVLSRWRDYGTYYKDSKEYKVLKDERGHVCLLDNDFYQAIRRNMNRLMKINPKDRVNYIDAFMMGIIKLEDVL